MSLHFDFAFACDLKPDTPQQIIDTLLYMTRNEDYPFNSPPQHSFFENENWRNILRVQSEKIYLAGDLASSFRKAYRYNIGSKAHYRYTLSFRCFLVDDIFYEMWWSLAEWLLIHSDTTGYVGYYREEFSSHPTLIYFQNDAVCVLETIGEPVPILNAFE